MIKSHVSLVSAVVVVAAVETNEATSTTSQPARQVSLSLGAAHLSSQASESHDDQCMTSELSSTAQLLLLLYVAVFFPSPFLLSPHPKGEHRCS